MAKLYETILELCQINEINITAMCRETGVSRASITDLKKGRSQTLSAESLSKIAKYFHVSIEFLLDEDTEKYNYLGKGNLYQERNEKKPAPEGELVNGDAELTEIMQRVRDDPHMRMLFSISKDATAEDLEKTIKIIQALRGG